MVYYMQTGSNSRKHHVLALQLVVVTTSMDYVKQITSMAGNVCRFVSSPEELSVNSKNCVVAVLLSD